MGRAGKYTRKKVLIVHQKEAMSTENKSNLN